MARMTKKQKDAVPASKRAGPKGTWPLTDKAHIRSARSYERFANPSEKKKIDAAAKKAGIGALAKKKTKKKTKKG
jgi:hypothetical protein